MIGLCVYVYVYVYQSLFICLGVSSKWYNLNFETINDSRFMAYRHYKHGT